MRELELKAVVPDIDACRERLIRHGATRQEAGAQHDRRFDAPDRALRAHDVVLRVREFKPASDGPERGRASLDWKGAARFDSGYKEREEISLGIADAATATRILERLGFTVSFEIEREIEVFHIHGAEVRFERYAQMDTLVEVEGTPAAIEQAIASLGIAREHFTTERLSDFARAYEARTGSRAAVSAAELAAPDLYARDDA